MDKNRMPLEIPPNIFYKRDKDKENSSENQSENASKKPSETPVADAPTRGEWKAIGDPILISQQDMSAGEKRLINDLSIQYFQGFERDGVSLAAMKDVVVRAADCEKPYIARILRLFQEQDSKVKYVALKWYYRPEDCRQGRLPSHGEDELVSLGSHTRVHKIECVESLCQVLSYGSYCRYRAQHRKLHSPGDIASRDQVFFIRHTKSVRDQDGSVKSRAKRATSAHGAKAQDVKHTTAPVRGKSIKKPAAEPRAQKAKLETPREERDVGERQEEKQRSDKEKDVAEVKNESEDDSEDSDESSSSEEERNKPPKSRRQQNRMMIISGRKPRTGIGHSGETKLLLAARSGDLVSMKRAIQQGIDIDAPDFAGWTPLHEACSYRHRDAVRLLLKNGADPNCRGPNNVTPLHDAADNNLLDIARLLLKFGADPKAMDEERQTPTDLADDHPEMLKLFENHKAKSGLKNEANKP